MKDAKGIFTDLRKTAISPDPGEDPKNVEAARACYFRIMFAEWTERHRGEVME